MLTIRGYEKTDWPRLAAVHDAARRRELALYRSLGFRGGDLVTGRMPGNEAFAVTVHCLKLEAGPPEGLQRA